MDFNYGGVSESEGVVYLSPKSGDRSGLSEYVKTQCAELGIEPKVGAVVVLIDPQADLDDDGTICDIQVEGIFDWVDDGHGWRATFDPRSMSWIPSNRIDG